MWHQHHPPWCTTHLALWGLRGASSPPTPCYVRGDSSHVYLIRETPNGSLSLSLTDIYHLLHSERHNIIQSSVLRSGLTRQMVGFGLNLAILSLQWRPTMKSSPGGGQVIMCDRLPHCGDCGDCGDSVRPASISLYNCSQTLLIMEALLENKYNLKCDQSQNFVMQWEYWNCETCEASSV